MVDEPGGSCADLVGEVPHERFIFDGRGRDRRVVRKARARRSGDDDLRGNGGTDTINGGNGNDLCRGENLTKCER